MPGWTLHVWMEKQTRGSEGGASICHLSHMRGGVSALCDITDG